MQGFGLVHLCGRNVPGDSGGSVGSNSDGGDDGNGRNDGRNGGQTVMSSDSSSVKKTDIRL